MKLVNFDDFCKMPAGTIFAPYEPCGLSDKLEIKVDAGYQMPADYPYYKHSFNGVMPLEPWNYDLLWSAGDQQEASFEIYDGATVDYMDHELFLIFEKEDTLKLINALLWSLAGCVEAEPPNYMFTEKMCAYAIKKAEEAKDDG